MGSNTQRLASAVGNMTIADPGDGGAIPNSLSGTCLLTTTAAETRTLADPIHAGLRLVLSLDTDGGDCVITAASQINAATNTIITFDAAGDVIVLEAINITGAPKWRVIGDDGSALS